MRFRSPKLFAAALAVISSSYLPAWCQNQAPSLQGHTSGVIGPKGSIETPLESNLHNPHSFKAAARFGKGRIENPLETSLSPTPTTFRAQSALSVGAVLGATRRALGTESTQQRKERPGLVSWHQNLKEARTASASTGKPVLLVHVLGNLDDHFC
jgi:hypothetical protein